MITIAGISCFALGVYAGKKRANGDGWMKISKDLCCTVGGVAKRACSIVSSPFRKDPCVVEAEATILNVHEK